VRDMHTTTGLLERVASPKAIPITDVDGLLSEWMATHGALKDVHLLGSSVSLDAYFMRLHMPLTFSRLHYRIVDVSSFGVGIEQWNPDLFNRVAQEGGESTHEAMADIRRSLATLRRYREALLPKGDQ